MSRGDKKIILKSCLTGEEPMPKEQPKGGILRVDSNKLRRSSGESVDFDEASNKLTAQVEPPSPQPSVDRLSVTFAEKSNWYESSVKINIFDPGSPPSQSDGEEEEEQDEVEDDYSASVSVIMQRRESMKRASSRRKKRRTSSPLPDLDGCFVDYRRRSSEYTNSSGDTVISIDNETTQEQIFENIRLHKEVLSNVKLQPWGMRRKIKLVQQAKAYVKKHEGELQERLAMSKSTKDILARFNIWLIKELRFLKRELANMMTLLIPWELRIKEIESHFGSAVASYFTFLRWMFWVNLVITIVLACFVAIPEMLTADPKTAGDRKEMLPEEKLTATNLVTLWDFGGVLKYSPIFYGYYTNRDRSGSGYRLPFAYFMTGLAVYVYSFVATLRRMAENSRMSKLSEKDDECVFTWKIFTGWDYMIGNAETAHNRVASLVLGFKEVLLEETERKKDEKNILVIGLLAFSAYIVIVVVERSTQPEANDSWWRQNETTVSVSIISLLFPFCFELLGLLEAYHPRKSLRIQLARIMVLNLLNLYTLIFSQFWKISDMTVELQNLKNNYTSSFSSGMTGTAAPICVFVAINCSRVTSPLDSTVISTTFPTVVTWTFSNITTSYSPFENFSDFDDLFRTWNYTTDGNVYNLTELKEYLTDAADISLSQGTSFSSEGNFSFDYHGDFESTTPFSELSSSETNSSALGTKNNSVYDYNPSWIFENSSLGHTTRGDVFAKNSTNVKLNGEDEGLPPDTCFMKKCEYDDQLQYNNYNPVYDMETRKRLRTLCWETMFGQELVKLTVMDLILTILSVLLLDFFRAIFVRVMNNCWCWDLEKKFPQYGDFKIAENILHLVYNQGMVWMGMFFSPGLPAINLIKLIIMMYLRSWAVLTCNVPHEVVFRASRSNNFYLALLLTMLFLCVLPVGFAIVWIEPSWHCGPFSDYKRIYHLFTKTLQKALPETLHKAFDYIASPGIIIPLLMLLVLIIYYLVSLTNSLREANNDLKAQLRRERTEERRKMFQMVNKRARKESKDSEMPFAKWKKLLPELAARQLTAGNDGEKSDKMDGDVAHEKIESDVGGDGKKEGNKKELLTRLMKKALGKSPARSDEQDLRIGEDVLRGIKENSPREEEKRFSCKVTGRKSGNSQLENIPEIRISKIESDEHLIKDDVELSGKQRFKSIVEKLLATRRKEKLGTRKSESFKRDDGSDLNGRGRAEGTAGKGGGRRERQKRHRTKTRNSGDDEEIRVDDGQVDGSRRCPIAKQEVIPSELNVTTDHYTSK
ncbi:hypothetical protein RUM44_009782 [Polyplax serrata]|uniref:TMC domain-containing protein n=1 Tax=Polyplax serrata TaxID=468196 RepID=A0ABR1ATQ6_POLSC